MKNKISLRHIHNDIAEKEIRELFKLHASNDNKFGPGNGIDAFDADENPFEIKMTTKKNGGVSTTRRVGVHTIERWRQEYWIIAQGIINDNMKFAITNIYFFHPEDLELWFSKIEQTILNSQTIADRAISILHKNNFEKLDKLQKIIQQGIKLDDPNIPQSYIRKNGTLITNNHSQTLRQLVKKRPLTKHKEIQPLALEKFFALQDS